jgi:hypothetical protein
VRVTRTRRKGAERNAHRTNGQYGRRCPIVWDKATGRVPLNRWQRSDGEIRKHAAFVAGLIADLRDVAGRCDGVLLGREAGPRFWRRFDANNAALERVTERDKWCAEVLEERHSSRPRRDDRACTAPRAGGRACRRSSRRELLGRRPGVGL